MSTVSAEDQEPGFRQTVTMIRIAIIAAAFEAIAAMLAAFALGGCTADQMLSQPLQPLPPGTPRVVCSPFNPIQYAQTCGFYVGGHHRSH
jgi:hypothetical protein